jgi:hypothetical protein
MQIMGHSSESEHFRSYQSKLAQVDIQGLQLRRKQDETLDFGMYLRVERGRPPPNRLPGHILQQIEDTIAQSGLQGQAVYNLRRSLRKQAWKDFVEEWHKQEQNIKEPHKRPSALIPDSVENFGDLAKADVQARIMNMYNPEYHSIANACNAEYFNIHRHVDLIDNLLRLCGK